MTKRERGTVWRGGEDPRKTTEKYLGLFKALFIQLLISIFANKSIESFMIFLEYVLCFKSFQMPNIELIETKRINYAGFNS